jgi:hypothetical protein
MDSRAVKFNPSPRKIDPRALYAFSDLVAFCGLEPEEAAAAEAFIRGLPIGGGGGSDLLVTPGRIILSWGWFVGAVREIRRRRSAAGGFE